MGPAWWWSNAPATAGAKKLTPPSAPAPGSALAVLTADCAPVGLSSPEGVFGHCPRRLAGAHGRGGRSGRGHHALAGGQRGVGRAGAVHPSPRLPFSDADLAMVAGPLRAAGWLGGRRRAARPSTCRRRSGQPLTEAGATLVGDAGTCTHCSPEHWSWRANGRPRPAGHVSSWVPAATAAAGDTPAVTVAPDWWLRGWRQCQGPHGQGRCVPRARSGWWP